MKQLVRLLAIALTLNLIAACASRTITLVPQTEGRVIALDSGQAVSSAEVTVPGTGVTVTTGRDGQFILSALTREESRAVLPVSGVFVDRADLAAMAGDLRAYGFAEFLSVSTEANRDVTLFAVSTASPADTSGVPEGCTASDQTRYALQILAASDSPVLQDWLATDLENRRYLRDLLRGLLFADRSSECAPSTAQRIAWGKRIDDAFERQATD